MTVQQAFEGFLVEQQIRGNSPKTLTYYQSGMNRFRGFLNQNPELSELTLSLLRKYALYLQSENLSTVTRQSYVRALRAFLTWLEMVKRYIHSTHQKTVSKFSEYSPLDHLL